MDIFLKVTAGVIVAVILSLTLSKNGKDVALLLTISVCAIVMMTSLSYLIPVLEFGRRLMQLGQLNSDLLNVLFKVVGIGFISQFSVYICMDAGNHALGKTLQILTSAVILCISVPLLEEVIEVLEGILGEV